MLESRTIRLISDTLAGICGAQCRYTSGVDLPRENSQLADPLQEDRHNVQDTYIFESGTAVDAEISLCFRRLLLATTASVLWFGPCCLRGPRLLDTSNFWSTHVSAAVPIAAACGSGL